MLCLAEHGGSVQLPTFRIVAVNILRDYFDWLYCVSAGLIAPYVSPARQNHRVVGGGLLLRALSEQANDVVTVYLHRQYSLDEIDAVPSYVVPGASALAHLTVSIQHLSATALISDGVICSEQTHCQYIDQFFVFN